MFQSGTFITKNLTVIRRVNYFPVLSRKGYKKAQELQGQKYMPHLSLADIRSLLFEEEYLCPGLKQLIRSFAQF